MEVKMIFFILLLFVLPLASAQIVFENNFNGVYSVGDLVHVNLSIQKPVSTSSYLETSLSCGGSNFLVGKNYVSVFGGGMKFVDFDFPISIYGNCHLKSTFDGDSQSSQQFNVSRDIKIDYDLNSISFSPGDGFLIKGTATKANGDLLNGTLKIFSSGLVEKTIAVSNGKFNYNFEIPPGALPGNHDFNLEAMEEDASNHLINDGESSFNITVRSVPSKIVSHTNFTEVDPPKNVTINFSLEDQAGNPISNEFLILKILDTENNILVKKTVKSPGKYSYEFPGNATLGLWSFGFYYGSLSSFSKVYVGENKNISFNVINNNTLLIKNVGNVLYNGIVTYSFQNMSNEENRSINVSLDAGKQMEVPLDLKGDYNLSVGGNSLGKFSFTGNAIIGDSLDASTFSYWVFLGILVFGIFIFLFFKRKSFAKTKSFFIRKKNPETKRGKYNRNLFLKTKSNMDVYSVFFKNFDENLKGFKEILKKYGWTLHWVNNKISFVLFYSNQKSSSKKIMKFAKEMLEVAKSEKVFLSISVNSEKFYNDKNLINKFALKSRKMLEKASSGEIIVSKKVLEDIGIKKGQRKVLVNVGEENFSAYII